MAPDRPRWGRIEEIFHQALEQPPDTLDRWLDEMCAGDTDLRAEVSSLLESDSAARGGFVGAKVQRAVLNLVEDESPNPAWEGRRIGAWRLVREIGRGGMGTVFLAARADQQYESSVAIKLVRPGLDADLIMDRFRRERRILARLDHPNITRLFDGGTTEEGIPYLVMEYIEGAWITRYAAEQRLSIEDRLRLCLPVCSAVAYAHRNFIVHRDLKPTNILIDRHGAPKLLDFGISKLLEGEAQGPMNTLGAGPMTPEYASPEQILGEPVTIASDVYSLGALIYELLTGTRPHKFAGSTPLALARAVSEEPVTAPSKATDDRAVAWRLKGDLDNILLRALQKDPTRRYISVDQFAEDLRRYLEHRPVVARPDSPLYRASKFVRRNRVVVILATLAAAAVLAGALISVREARIANERFEDVRKLATTFVFDVEEAARDLPGSLRVRQLITRTGVDYLNRLARSSARDWDLKRELAGAYLRIGRVQGGSISANVGDTTGAMASFVSAGKLLDEVLWHSPEDRQASLDRLEVYTEIAGLQIVSQQSKDVGALAQAGLPLAQSLLRTNPNDLEAIHYAGLLRLRLASFDQTKGNVSQALRESVAAGQLLERYAQSKPYDRAAQEGLSDAYSMLAAEQLHLGHTKEGLASARSAAAVLEAVASRYPNDTALRRYLIQAYFGISNTLGSAVYPDLLDPQGAFEAGRKMVEEAKFVYDADPADVEALSDYGVALMHLGEVTPPHSPARRKTFELSETFLTRAALRNPRSRTVMGSKTELEYRLAELCLADGRRAEAMRYYQMAISTGEKAMASDPSYFPTLNRFLFAVRAMSQIQARQGTRADALATLDRLLRAAKRADDGAKPTDLILHVVIVRSWQTAGSLYATLSRHETGDQAGQDRDAARAWYQRALDQWRKLEPQPGFSAGFRKEMQAAEQALAPGGLDRAAEAPVRAK